MGKNVVEYFWAMRKLFSLAEAAKGKSIEEQSAENIMKNRLNFVAATNAVMCAILFFFLRMINTPIWQLARNSTRSNHINKI